MSYCSSEYLVHVINKNQEKMV